MLRLKRLLLVLYLLHGPGQLLDRFPVSPPPCSRPRGRGFIIFLSVRFRDNNNIYLYQAKSGNTLFAGVA
jgi:hypothetical protein